MATQTSGNGSSGLWPPVPVASPAPWLALGIHLGLGLICFSVIYTRQPADFPLLRWTGVGAVGLVLIISAIVTKGRASLQQTGRLLLALGAGLALSLSFEPQLADVPGLAAKMGPVWAELCPSVATVGVALAFGFWLLFYLADGERGLGPIPFRRSLLLAAGLVVGVAAVMYIVLNPLYGLDGGQATIAIVFVVIQYTALLAAVLGSCGGPGIRAWPFYYIGVALLTAFVRFVMTMPYGLSL